jgi:protein TonB
LRTEPLPTRPRATAWWESSIVLALAGALAIHLIIGTAGDVLVVMNPPRPDPPPAPMLEVFDVEVPPPREPPPLPLPEKTPDPVAPDPPQRLATHAPPRPSEPLPTEPPPTSSPPSPTSPEGGGPVVAMPGVAPGATGVAVATGLVNPGRIGRGGSGTGTGAGTGSGTGDAPMSVATIKTRAMPRSDYAHEEIKDFPADAKRLGIEGKIRVKLIVDERGVVASAILLNKLGAGLDELAMVKAKAILFDPARDTDDHPVASVVVWTFDMVAPK